MNDSPTLSSPPNLLPADRFHTGARLASMLWWLTSAALVFFAGAWVGELVLGPGNFLWVVWLVATLFVSHPLARLGEKVILRWWPSGRAVQLEPHAVLLREKGGEARRLDCRQKVNYLRWRFDVRGRRGGRVPNGHHCFAIRLVQDEQSMIIYAFLSPAQAEALGQRLPFYELRRPNEMGKQPLGGRDATFLAAEHERWEHGAELDAADFGRLMTHLQTRLPDFAASSAS
jgi:hypothetical protein